MKGEPKPAIGAVELKRRGIVVTWFKGGAVRYSAPDGRFVALRKRKFERSGYFVQFHDAPEEFIVEDLRQANRMVRKHMLIGDEGHGI